MCRAIAEGGRRCPGQSNPVHRVLANIKQRIGRHDRSARQWGEREDWPRHERYIGLLERALTDYERHTVPPAPLLALPPTRASQYTPEAAVALSDRELIEAFNQLHDDPDAQEQILATLDFREEEDRARDEAIAERKRQEQAVWDAAWAATSDDASPLTNPARRKERRLSADDQCREDYDAHVFNSFMAAEHECRGVLLNREGQAKDIDAMSLFSGQAARVRRYASEELKTWFGRNGRVTYQEWKYSWFGRDSDRKAAQTARHQSIGEAVA